jgi:hypothetical protein
MLENRADNPVNIARNSVGQRRIFIDVRTNPQMVYLNTDLPGKAVNVKVVNFSIDAVAQPYYQIDFGTNTTHDTSITFGAKSSSVQVISGVATRTKIPMRFYNDKIPQYFQLSIYNPGEPSTLVALGANGAQIDIQYSYIAT